MAGITPEAAAYCLDEKKLMELRELVEEDDDAEAEAALEEDFRALLSMAADLEDEEGLTPEKWEWVEKTEALALSLTTPMREQADEIRQAAAALASLRPGEAAFAEALRKQAALTDSRRADAERLLTARAGCRRRR
nr:unnamed protein product [Digitaria exilis]